MQGSKFSCLVFVRNERKSLGDANFSGGEMILIGQFFAVLSPGSMFDLPAATSIVFTPHEA